MIGFIIGLFKESDNEPMSLEQLQQAVMPYIPYLRKRKGERYVGQPASTVQGVTLSYGKLFIQEEGKMRLNVSSLDS